MSIKKLIYIGLAWIAVFSLLGNACLLFMLANNQDNGRVVNYSGIVRGGTQRAIKLHLLEQPVDDVVANLEKTIDGLIDGDSSLGLPKATDPAFLQQMTQVRNYWKDQVKQELIHEPGDHSPASLLEKSETFFSMTNEAVNAAEAFTAQGIMMMKVVATATVCLNLICIVIIARIIRRRVLKPIKYLEHSVSQVADGNLSVEVDYNSQDELGALSASLRSTISSLNQYIMEIQRQLHELSGGNLDIDQSMVFHGDFKAIGDSLQFITRSFNETIRNINGSADQVADSSSQIAASMQSLASNVSEEAQSMETLLGTTEKISAEVKNSAEYAKGAKEKIAAVGTLIAQCGARMKSMLQAMDKIEESSHGIEKITKTVEDISFQTNILALNAAVEASRAGAAGKGFSVVADEVRSLASKSSESVQDTASLIENSILAVHTGTELANDTAALLQDVITMTQEVIDAVELITTSSSSQSASIEGINYSVGQVDSMVQSSSSVTQESAAASEELSGQARLLKEMVSRFHLKPATSPR